MAVKEIRLRHEDIADPQTITDVNEKAFKDAGLSMHRDELIGEELIDDHDKKVRVLRVRGRRTFIDLGQRSRR